MRLLPLVLVLGVVAASAPPAAAAPRCHRTPPQLPPRVTVVQTEQVRVYRRGPEGEREFFACARRTGRTIKLGEENLDTGFAGFRAAGRYVAYREEYAMRCCGDAHVTVRLLDAVRPRIAHSWSYALYGHPGSGDAVLRMRGQKLLASGAYAFMIGAYEASDDTDAFGAPVYDVVVASPKRAEVVDTGPDIEPRSFSATRTTVRWRRGGRARSAPMP